MSIDTPAPVQEETPRYPYEDLLRADRLPHIWCPACGIGTTVNCFAAALRNLNLDLDRVVVVSGIGCTGRVAGYVNLDSFHTTHGRAIPFATGLKMANPDLKVIVVSGDGDLVSIGGNHFIHAARRNVDMTVICVNNFNYAMTGGQVSATTPTGAMCTTMPYGNYEQPFNLAGLAASCGAVYVARWTTWHVWKLTKALEEAISKRGFSFVEVISPCPTLYTRRNKLGTGLDRMKDYRKSSQVSHGADPTDVGIEMRGRIPVGKFKDIEKPTLRDRLDQHMQSALGEGYHRIDPTQVVRSDRRALRDE